MDVDPNRMFEYITAQDLHDGYKQCVITELMWLCERMIVESEEFNALCEFSRKKKVHPTQCALQIIEQMGWSQTQPNGHGHEEDNNERTI